MKIKERMNLFTCFRPVAVENKAAVEKRKRKEGNGCGVVVSGDGGKESTVVLSDDQVVKENPRRSLSRALKVVLFHKSSSKKNGSHKYTKGNAPSKQLPDGGDITRTSSNGSSLFTSSTIGSSSKSSSSASSFASNSRSPSERKSSIDLKQMNYNKNRQVIEDGASGCLSSSDIGFCFLLVCVLVLINWGKVIAIFCTSLCFFFAPRRSKVILPRANDEDILDIDSKEYKKRVIMEGLLERSRTRSL